MIHFTVDPDLALAATSPVLDLAGVRFIVTARPLGFDDLAPRVRAQVGHERTARLLAGMQRLRTEGGALAIGPVTLADDERFAFTLTTPFALDVTAESEAGELAWGLLVRGPGAGIVLTTTVLGVASDATTEPQTVATGEQWHEERVTLARAGERRRVRLRLDAVSRDGTPAAVSIGNLGFGPGAAAEARLAAERRRPSRRGGRSAPRGVSRPSRSGSRSTRTRTSSRGPFASGRVEPVGERGRGAHASRRRVRLPDRLRSSTTDDVTRGERGTQPAAPSISGEAAARTPRSSARGTSRPIETDGLDGALLVLADLAFPGWHADVDGRAAPVLTVDGVLRGVVVPAGLHRIGFRYRPTSVMLGAFLSSLALVGSLVPRADRRRQAPEWSRRTRSDAGRHLNGAGRHQWCEA